MLKWLPIVLLAGCPGAVAMDQASLQALLKEARVEMKMPGLRAAVRLPDGEMVRAAVGLGDVEAKQDLDNDIGMPGGSTGKMFAAALTMLLVEEGVLGLDDPASKWLGETAWFKRLPNADAIRVRHLLSHTAGIKDYPTTARFHMAMVWRVLRQGSARFEPEELIRYSLNKRAPFQPGEGFQYSDTGYLVLGRLIEAASGRTYYGLLQERILDPLGLDQVRVADQSVLTHITPGYSYGARNLKKDGRMKLDPSSEWTGGGLVTTPTMLVRFLSALSHGEIVKPATLTEMLEPGWRRPSSDYSYGLGLFLYDGGRSFGHGGLWPGYRTRVEHIPEAGLTIAVQTNRDGRVDLKSLIARIAKRCATTPGHESTSVENSIAGLSDHPQAGIAPDRRHDVVPELLETRVSP